MILLAKKKTQEFVLNGRNIFYDKHKRAIYFKKRSGIGYVIPKDYEKKFQIFTYRYMVGLIGFIFSYMIFDLNIPISLIIGIACWAILEYRFHNVLKNMTQLKNFVPEKTATSDERLKELDMGALFLRCILYFALSVLLIVNLYTGKGMLDDIAIVVASIIVSIGSAVMGIRMVMTMAKKRSLQ